MDSMQVDFLRFGDDTILATKIGIGDALVCLNALCGNLGLPFERELSAIRSRPHFAVIVEDTFEGQRLVWVNVPTCIWWLLSIDPARVQSHVYRAKLVAYQTEWVRALGDYVSTGVAINPTYDPVRVLEIAQKNLERGGLEPRDVILLKDCSRNVLVQQIGGQATGGTVFVPVPDRCRQLGYSLGPNEEIRVGQAVAKHYRRRLRKDPPKHQQFVNGRPCMVCGYTTADLHVVDAAIHDYFQAKRGRR